MRTTSLSKRRKAVAALGVAAVAAAAAVALAPNANAVTAPTMTLNTTTGSAAGGGTLVGTTSVAAFSSGSVVQLQFKAGTTSACATTKPTDSTQFVAATASSGVVSAATPATKVASSKKIAFQVPAAANAANTAGIDLLTPAAANATSATYLICVYDSTGATLQASGSYTVSAPPTVTGVSIVGGNTGLTLSGPALGLNTVKIYGTNFNSGTTAKIGTVALTGVVLATDKLSLTGVVPAQTASSTGKVVSVANAGGTSVATNVLYTYTDGIVVDPATTPTGTAAQDIDVSGVGFSTLSFVATDGTTPNSANAHVYVTNGNYTTAPTTKTHPQIGECLNVLALSDTELICTVDTLNAFGGSGSAIADGTYTITVVSDGSPHTPAAGDRQSIVSSGSTFTVAPY